MKVPPGYFVVLEMALQDPNFVKRYVKDLQSGAGEAAGFALAFAQDPEQAVTEVKKKAKRKKSAYSRALSKELKAINKQARTKSGKLRKGMTQKKILAKAHRAVKRRLK